MAEHRRPDHGMDLDKAVGSCDQHQPIILLAHQPEAAKRALDSSYNIQLVLSGALLICWFSCSLVISIEMLNFELCRSVCHTSEVSPAKTAEPFEIWFGLRTRVGSGNHILDWGLDTPIGRGNFGESRAHCKYRDFLPWAVKERPNQSICCLDCGLEWSKGSTSSNIFDWTVHVWRQCSLMSDYFYHLLWMFVALVQYFITPVSFWWPSPIFVGARSKIKVIPCLRYSDFELPSWRVVALWQTKTRAQQ